MRLVSRLLLTFFVCCLAFGHSYAQIAITFPVNRIVFQRNNSNQATVQIAGNYYQTIDKVEARFTSTTSGWGTDTDWQTIQTSPTNGSYSGSVTLSGGWYKLEVRGSYQGTVLDTQSVEKIGVGEVFIIAGQSNAQGVSNYAPSDPSDDRINCINEFYDNGFTTDPSYPVFSKMTSTGTIAPYGNGSWCWGYLGEYLTQRLNVPVLFYNAARGSTTINNWVESSEGTLTVNRYCMDCSDDQKYYTLGIPYYNLRTSLNYFASLTGVRGILWHQGESDGYTWYTTEDSYRTDLLSVISKSRSDFGRDISWVVARASFADFQTWQPVVDAQTSVVNYTSNVYLGPNTDEYGSSYRSTDDGTHFTSESLQTIGQAWSDALTDSYFTNTTPLMAQSLASINATCAGTSTIILDTPNQTPYGWSNSATTSTITVSGGTYSARIKDTSIGSGITIFSQPYKVPDDPTIGGNILNDNGSIYYCEGVEPLLQSSYSYNNTWSTGDTTASIVAPSTGNYSVTFNDAIGCNYSSSTINLTQRARPAKPTITADGDLSFCEGTVRTLSTDTAAAYAWSNGATSATIQPTVTGAYSVQVINSSQCYSLVSDDVDITVNPIPVKPTISANRTIDNTSTVAICANEDVQLTSTPSESTYLWTYNNASTISITTSEAGSYQVQTISLANCPSPLSDPVTVKVNPLPDKPVVSVLSGVVAFCEGGSVTLLATAVNSTVWLLGTQQVSSTSTVVATITGDYYAQAIDSNNCKSLSDPLTVTVRPNPTTPTISQPGPYTLEANATLPGTIYIWRVATDTITVNGSNSLKPQREGVYNVRSIIQYTVEPVGLFECTSEESDPFGYYYDTALDGFVVYPNPTTTGSITLETQENWKNAVITITSLTGQVIFTGTVDEFNERKLINLGKLPGIFILKLSTQGFERTRRILVAQ
ncbi:MAG: sialate O-acetylesterase [Siphonobacter sp.]